MRRSPQLVAVLNELEAAGIKPEVEQARRSSHAKVYFTVNGVDKTYVCGTSKGGPRAQKNARADIKRMLKKMDIKPEMKMLDRVDATLTPTTTKEPDTKALKMMYDSLKSQIDSLSAQNSNFASQLEALTQLMFETTGKKTEGATSPVTPRIELAISINGMDMTAVAKPIKGQAPVVHKSLPKPGTLYEAIYGYLDKPARVFEIARNVDRDVKTIQQYMYMMKKRGWVEKLSHNEWRRVK